MTALASEPVAADPEWVRCDKCGELTYGPRYRRNTRVCPHCQAHGRLTAAQRVECLFDEGSVVELPYAPVPEDPLTFRARQPYPQSLARARDLTGMPEAVLCVRGTVEGEELVAAVLDFRFLGGSMGVGVGEAVTRAAEVALRERLPLLLVTASGGARMQEGALSLMQMAKTSQALAALDEAGVLTLTLVTDPTYGGVAASFAVLTDVVLAEPGARFGFAGPRVIEQTTRQRLPDGFQTAEFLLARGLVDDVVPRVALRGALARLLRVRARPEQSDIPAREPVALVTDPGELPDRPAWEAVRLARHPERPTTADYLSYLLTDFHELHGDRIGGDSAAIVAGIGRLDGEPVVLIGHDKGHRTAERAARNFGMPTPAGYRKAARVMRLAAKLGLPVVTLIDTPGADPGLESESGGQAVAIAENLRLMSRLPVPVISVVIGEGGSGGALAVGVGNLVYALQNAVYSVISPEGCAAILWNDAGAARAAAAALRLTPRDLLGQRVIDAVVPEPDGGAHTDPIKAAEILGAALGAALAELRGLTPEALVAQRRGRFRALGGPQSDARPNATKD